MGKRLTEQYKKDIEKFCKDVSELAWHLRDTLCEINFFSTWDGNADFFREQQIEVPSLGKSMKNSMKSLWIKYQPCHEVISNPNIRDSLRLANPYPISVAYSEMHHSYCELVIRYSHLVLESILYFQHTGDLDLLNFVPDSHLDRFVTLVEQFNASNKLPEPMANAEFWTLKDIHFLKDEIGVKFIENVAHYTDIDQEHESWLNKIQINIAKECQRVTERIPNNIRDSRDPFYGFSIYSRKEDKISPTTRKAIELLEKGVSINAISERLKLSASNVRQIKSRYLTKRDTL